MSDRQPAATDGAFAALSAIAALSPDEAIDAYRDQMRAAYWDHKDLATAAGIALGGFSRLMAAAENSNDTDAAFRYRSAAKGLAYDHASFAWPGWGEDGIEISPNEAAAGLAAARINAQLALDLEKGPLPESRAHWMVGAHLLTAADHAGAATEFERAAVAAGSANEATDVALNHAYQRLAELAGGTGSHASLDDALRDLKDQEHGPDFVDQVRSVAAVIGVELAS